MRLALTIIFVIALVLPALLLTILIWIFGGWTKGWDYMPNPVYSLLKLLDY